MDYSASGVSALVLSVVLGLPLGLLAAGVRLAVSHTTHRKGVNFQ